MFMGLDIGYGQTKLTYAGPHIAPVGEIHPSGSAPLNLCDRASIAPGDALGYGCEVVVGNETFGALIDPDRIHRGMPNLHADYSATPEYMALYYGALSRCPGDVIDHLCTGLPVAQFMDPKKKAEVIARLSGRHQIQARRNVEVRRVSVIPQAYAGYASELDRMPLGTAIHDSLLVVDFGHYSVDWVLVVGGNWRKAASGSSIEGGSFVIDRMSKLVEERFGMRIGAERLFAYVRQGAATFDHGKHTIDLKELKSDAAALVAPAVIARIRSSLRDQSTDVGQVWTCGGSTPFFDAALSEAFPNAKHRPIAHSVMANAIGYRLYAQSARVAA